MIRAFQFFKNGWSFNLSGRAVGLSRWVILAGAILWGPISMLGAQSVEALRNSVGQWVDVEQAISKEAIAWSEKKRLLEDLIALAEDELASLKEEIQRSTEQTSAADEKRASLIAEEKRLDASQGRIGLFLVEMEKRLIRLRPQLPVPLLESLQGSYDKLGDRSSTAGGQTAARMQAVVSILDSVQNFDRMLTVSEEVRLLDEGVSGQVRTIYLGLGAAYYLSEANADAGLGVPSPDGWKWVSRPDIRDAVERVLAMVDQSYANAAFVPLPYSLRD